MSDKISYSEEELAEMTVKNHYLLRAQMNANSVILGYIAEKLEPGMGKKIEHMYEKCWKQFYTLHVESDPRIEDALLRQKLKDELGDLKFEE